MLYLIRKLTIILLLTACEKPKLANFFILPPAPIVKNVKVALVLGGGGAKGIAHAGVLEILEHHKIPIDLIVGASAGSAIGALYADEPDSLRLKEKIMQISRRDLLDPSLINTALMFGSLRGPIRGKNYQKFLNKNLIHKSIEDLKIPLVIVTTNINNNDIYLIKSGPIVPAVYASSAIPPFFSPVILNNMILVDGGVITPVPVSVAKDYNPALVIAVDISAPPPVNQVVNMFDISYRSIWIYYYRLSRLQSTQADIDIHPDLENYGTFEDHRKEQLYQLGKKAACEAMPNILRRLKELNIPLNSHKSSAN